LTSWRSSFCGARFEDISEPAREQLKLRVLDSLGCALGALDGEPVRIVAAQCGSSAARRWRR
jgi:2-methylcitrate dehydratase PrpD